MQKKKVKCNEAYQLSSCSLFPILAPSIAMLSREWRFNAQED